MALAKERSSRHQERLAEVDELTLDDDELPPCPTMDKAQMMENFDGIVTDPRVTLASGRLDGGVQGGAL